MVVMRTIFNRRPVVAFTVAIVMGAGMFPAHADVGLPGDSYTGASEPTGYKPQSKLWYHSGLWWGVLFNATSKKYEIYKYTPGLWRWATTGVVVEDRPTAKVDALLDGNSLYIAAAVPAALPNGTKSSYVHQFHYDGTKFVRDSGAKGKVELENTAVEEIVLAKDSTGALWANWSNAGSVWVTHSTNADHTSWVTAYPLVSGLVSGNTGDSASIVAFGGNKIGVMWSNSVPLGANGFHFAVHLDGDGDAVSADPLLSDWTFEAVPPGGPNEADDHINLKSLASGEVLAAVKHNHALGTDPQISVLRRDAASGTWTSHVVWRNSSNTTRPIIEIDTTAGRAHVFASGLYSGAVYRKDASLGDLVFPEGDGEQFLALTSSSLDNATSTKQSVSSSSGLLVMAGDDGHDQYAFNYLTLGAPMVPAWPSGVTGVSGNASVTLSWSPPGNNGGSGVTGYVVTPYLNGVPLAPQTFLSIATTQTVVGLAIGTAYTFTVQARNAVGTGPASAPSAPVSTFGLPGAPAGVSALAGNKSAAVSWTPPASNGGSPITGYTVTSSPGGITATAGGTATSAVVSGLTNGTSYTFTVKATSVIGTGPASAPSAPVVPRAVPGSPTAVTAAPGNGSAAVSWNAPGDSGGSPITGYRVSWAVNGVEQSAQTFMSAATTQTITGLANGTAYTFRVAGINAVGAGLASAPSAPVIPGEPVFTPALSRSGYWMLGAGGIVYGFGDARDQGEPGTAIGTSATVDIEPNPAGDGYWVVDDSGRVYAYGVPHLGNADTTNFKPGERVTSLSATAKGDGYWIFTTRGRALEFGTARSYGDLRNMTLNGPVLDSVATPSGQGYYMVASDGGVFAFGDARFYGSMGNLRLNAPVQSLVPDPDGVGYWLVASDGGIFAFQAPFRGSMGSVRLNRPVTGMVAHGNGYLMVGEDGGVFNFSDRPFSGSLGANPPARPIVSVASLD